MFLKIKKIYTSKNYNNKIILMIGKIIIKKIIITILKNYIFPYLLDIIMNFL